MKTEIFTWTNYSCNNSSDIRLVAKFASAKEAKAMLKKSLVFFEQHAEEHDEKLDGKTFKWDSVTDAAKKFGDKFGHEWKGYLIWGDEGLEGDEPEGEVLGSDVVFYHTYMGGYGDDFPEVLKKAGATSVEQDDGPPVIYGEFTFGGGSLQEELTEMFRQRAGVDMDEWEFPWEIEDEICADEEDAAMVVDGKTCRFTLPLPVVEFDGLQEYLKAGKAKKISLRIATSSDIKELVALHDAADAESLNSGSDEETFDPSGLSFLFTGKLASMTRKEAQARVDEIGGENAKSVTKNLDVLVIGDEGSPLYGEGSKGSKQKKADKLIESGSEMKIISESLFLQLG